MILPTTYLGALSWYRDYLSEPATIEVDESFEKQTFRNRCLIRDAKGQIVRLTVPVAKVEHKQLTRDIRISYQQKWQHQHWMALVSAYEHTPYFPYYEDYLRPFYEREIPYLLDLNEGLTAVLCSLLRNEQPKVVQPLSSWRQSPAPWHGQVWTDSHPWQTELSILDTLCAQGPQTLCS